MTMIKYLFSDMDGTLLDAEGYVSDENAKALSNAQLPLSLVSARSAIEMDEAIEALDLTTLQVAFNGGLIYRPTPEGRKIYSQTPLEFDVAKRIILDLRAAFPSLSVSFYDVDAWFTDQFDAGIELEERITRQRYTLVNLQEKLEQTNLILFKIMMVTFSMEELQEVEAFLQERYSNERINVQRSGHGYLEVTHCDAQKARGIEFILAHEGLAAEEVAAFGDGHNDISMLRMVGKAIVMENASDEVKVYADFITTANTQHGVAHALKHYINQ
ncbi:Cof-type HAD-IIB family hydrolase [Aerococcaceae bacterium NML190073]|nr:Cof-type HAD-IIB family hydrolase [Aerococcaceae bacterium NML190073]